MYSSTGSGRCGVVVRACRKNWARRGEVGINSNRDATFSQGCLGSAEGSIGSFVGGCSQAKVEHCLHL